MPRRNLRFEGESIGEATLMQHIKGLRLPEPAREVPWNDLVGPGWPSDAYRCDFVWLERSLIVEVEGMSHRERDRFESDCVKYNALTIAGFRVLRFTTKMVQTGNAANLLEQFLRDGARA